MQSVQRVRLYTGPIQKHEDYYGRGAIDSVASVIANLQEKAWGHRRLVSRADYSPSILIGSQNIETTWANEQIDLVIKPLQHLRKLSFSGLEVDIEESFWNGLHQIRTLPGQQPYLFDKIIMFYDLLAQAKGVPIQYDEATQGLRKVPGTTSS